MNKKFVLVIVLIFFLAGGMVVFWRYKNFSRPSAVIKEKTLAEAQRNLTSEQQKIYLDKIQIGEDALKKLDLTNPASKGQQISIYTYMAQQYQGLGKLESAKEMYIKALQLDSSHEQIRIGLALVFIEGGKLEDADLLFKQALENNQQNPDVWLRYIELRRSLGDSNEQINSIYEKALHGTERAADILTSSAQFQEKMGQISQAIGFWQEAVVKYPQNAPAYKQEIVRLERIIKDSVK